MRNLAFFLVEYRDSHSNKIKYIKILACDEAHARNDFNVMFRGKPYVIIGITRLYREWGVTVNLYMIEYYDTELDITDYTTVTASNEIDAMNNFIRSTHGTKIVVECDRLGGVKNWKWGLTMDALTTKQKNQMYDEIAELLIKYGKDKTAKRMIKAFFHECQEIATSKELCNMGIVLISLKHLLEITFPNK